MTRLSRVDVWRLLAIGVGLVAMSACSTPTRDPVGAAASPALERVEAVVPPAVRERAEDHAVAAVHALADAYDLLAKGRHEEGVRRLEVARTHVRAAQALLPAHQIRWTRRSGDSVYFAASRDPVAIPLERIEDQAIRRLRPYRSVDVDVLNLDLDVLERRLTRSLTGPPRRMVGEVLLAAASALSFEGRARARLADEEAAPPAAGERSPGEIGG